MVMHTRTACVCQQPATRHTPAYCVGTEGRREPWSPLCGPCVVCFSGRDVLLGAELDEGALDWQVRGTISTGSKNDFHRKMGEKDEEQSDSS